MTLPEGEEMLQGEQSDKRERRSQLMGRYIMGFQDSVIPYYNDKEHSWNPTCACFFDLEQLLLLLASVHITESVQFLGSGCWTKKNTG